MPAPLVTFTNSTEVVIQWYPETFHHGGPIGGYQLNIISQQTEENFEQTISGSKTKVKLALDAFSGKFTPDCSNASITYLYNFSMRAVTFDETDRYYGPWSPVEVVPAYCGGKKTLGCEKNDPLYVTQTDKYTTLLGLMWSFQNFVQITF